METLNLDFDSDWGHMFKTTSTGTGTQSLEADVKPEYVIGVTAWWGVMKLRKYR